MRLDALPASPSELSDAALRRCCAARSGAGARSLTAALADELPLFKRDGGFVRDGYERALDEARALRDESPQGDRRNCRPATPTTPACKSLKITAQQRAGLFRRRDRAARRQADERAAERHLHPPPDPGRPGPLHHHGARRAGSQDRQRRRPRAQPRAGDIRAAARPRRSPRATAIKAAAEALALLDVSSRAGDARGRARAMCAPRSTARSTSSSRAAAMPWSSRRSAIRSSPTIATCRRRRARTSGAHLAAHRPEHGRQVHVPAPERADRRAGADGQLRAGEARQDRRGRPAVLARRRRRRSRPRPLDFHGRDGRDRRDPQSGRRTFAGHPRRDRPRHRDLRRPVDRLGRDRAPAREQPLPRAVRDAFPRADGARRPSCRACTTPPCA